MTSAISEYRLIDCIEVRELVVSYELIRRNCPFMTSAISEYRLIDCIEVMKLKRKIRTNLSCSRTHGKGSLGSDEIRLCFQ